METIVPSVQEEGSKEEIYVSAPAFLSAASGSLPASFLPSS